MPTVNIHQAKTHLSEYLKLVQEGEEVIIAKNNLPIAKLVSVLSEHKRHLGLARGSVLDMSQFFEADEEIIKDFEESINTPLIVSEPKSVYSAENNNFLLDTCTYLWLINNPEQISLKVRDICSNPNNNLYLSSISLWEISTKLHLNKIKLRDPIENYSHEYKILHKIQNLNFTFKDALFEQSIEFYHKDPFDRMLICQSLNNNYPILTPDDNISKYPVSAIW